MTQIVADPRTPDPVTAVDRAPAGERGPLPLVSVIIPVRNDAERLRRCLGSIKASRYPADRIQVVVADNGSTDGSPAVGEQAGATVLLFPRMRVSEVRNQAARRAAGDVLAFVDADHEVDPDYLAHAVESLQRTGAGAVGAAYYAPADGTWVQRLYDGFRLRTQGLRAVEWLGSGSLVVRRDVFAGAGGFDSSLETCEDVDFCARLRRRGYVLLNDDRLHSVHLGDPPTLRALFFGELWRGRDNLRVSLRGPFTLRSLPSIIIPMANLALVVVAACGVLAFPFGGLPVAAVALAAMAALSGVRMVRMLLRVRWAGAGTVPRAFVVAFVYEIARALALVARAPYRIRQVAALTTPGGAQTP